MKKNILFLFLIIGLIITLPVLTMIGATKISFMQTIKILLGGMGDETNRLIIWNIRIPRIILSMVIGASLSAAGVVFQGMLRNPLADPYTLGVSGGAALGTCLGIILGYQILLPALAALGATFSIFLVYLLAQRKGFSLPTLILGGVILSFLFSSLVLLILTLANPEEIHSIIFFLVGTLTEVNPKILPYVIGINILGIILLNFYMRDLNLLTLGEEKARSLGVEVNKSRKILFLLSSIITGSSVSVSGIIGFVGLIIPHFMRLFTGPDHRILFSASCLSGAIFLAVADTIARSITTFELPVGVITGIIGGSLLLFFLVRYSKEWFY